MTPLTRPPRLAIVLATSFLAISGCAVTPPREINERYREALLKRLQQYTVKEGDALDIKVYKQETAGLNQTGTVLPDGRTDIALMDNFRAAGKTLPEIQAELKAKFMAEVRDPDLILQVKPQEETVYLLGELIRPGPLVLRPLMTVSDAVAVAGGVRLTASPWHVLLRRPYLNPLHPDWFRIDIDDRSEEIFLLPGDTIEVEYNTAGLIVAVLREYIFGILPSSIYGGAAATAF
jgi:protein involved in polysaccharide export with SLBB domain